MRIKLISALLLLSLLNLYQVFGAEKAIELNDIFQDTQFYALEDDNSIIAQKLNLLNKYLNQQKTNINSQDAEGYTPLMLSIRGILITQRGLNQQDVKNVVFNIPKELINFILNKTTDINHQANNGKTALHIAAEEQNNEVIGLLLARGADKSLRDSAGKLARDYIIIDESDSQEEQKNKRNLLDLLNPVKKKLNFDDRYISFAKEALIKDQTANVQLPIQRTFFSNTNIKSILIGLINSETRYIYIAIFAFNDNDIADALIAAQKRYVRVEIVSDSEQAKTNNKEVFQRLFNAGIPIYIWSHGTMHNKFIIFGSTLDKHNLIWHGSYNFTSSAACYNQENVTISEDKETVSQFNDEFTRLKEGSQLLIF